MLSTFWLKVSESSKGFQCTCESHDAIVVKSIVVNIQLANTLWNWDKDGRASLPPEHAQKSRLLLRQVLNDMMYILHLPTFNRGRHRFTQIGQRECSEISPRIDLTLKRITYTIKQCHEQIEVLKARGLPANEASRANQYHWFLLARIERVFNFKVSRVYSSSHLF